MRKGFLNQYHIGDARSISEFFPSEEFVDVTITSPPYWNLKNYGSRQQVGFGQTYESYLDDLEQIFTSIYRVTKRTGSLWVVADTIKHKGELKLFPFDLADRLKKIGWIHHDIIIWNKDKSLPWSHRGKLRNIFEYILFFSKGSHPLIGFEVGIHFYGLPECRDRAGQQHRAGHQDRHQGDTPTQPAPKSGEAIASRVHLLLRRKEYSATVSRLARPAERSARTGL